MENSIPHKQAMDNARASVSMEGYQVTPLMDELCRKVLDGKITLGDSISILRQDLNRKE